MRRLMRALAPHPRTRPLPPSRAAPRLARWCPHRLGTSAHLYQHTHARARAISRNRHAHADVCYFSRVSPVLVAHTSVTLCLADHMAPTTKTCDFFEAMAYSQQKVPGVYGKSEKTITHYQSYVKYIATWLHAIDRMQPGSNILDIALVVRNRLLTLTIHARYFLLAVRHGLEKVTCLRSGCHVVCETQSNRRVGDEDRRNTGKITDVCVCMPITRDRASARVCVLVQVCRSA